LPQQLFGPIQQRLIAARASCPRRAALSSCDGNLALLSPVRSGLTVSCQHGILQQTTKKCRRRPLSTLTDEPLRARACKGTQTEQRSRGAPSFRTMSTSAAGNAAAEVGHQIDDRRSKTDVIRQLMLKIYRGVNKLIKRRRFTEGQADSAALEQVLDAPLV